MIVLDASVVVELLINGALADSLRRDLDVTGGSFIVPHLLDVEVASALRKLVAPASVSIRIAAGSFLRDLQNSPPSVTRTYLCWAGFGNCATTLPPTTPLTSLWR